MRIRVEILVVIAALVACVGCKSLAGFRADDEAVARVGSTYLYRSELASLMPSGIVAADSVTCSKTIISKWIVTQLKHQEAEELFEKSSKDIDKLVEDYRRSLLVQRLERHYLESEPCGEISDKAITDYYNAHKNDFRITKPMVKGEIVAMGDNYRRRKQMLEWFQSSSPERREDFVEICRKEKIPYVKFEEWTPFSDFLSNLPLLRTSSHEELLSSRNLLQIHYDKTYYYYRITDALKVGDAMPLDMAKENVRQILTTSHSADVIRRHEEQMQRNALSSGQAEIFD